MAVSRHRADIDGLRAVAILPVCLGHASISGFSGGFVGVDVFFVISGYLITGILAREVDAGTFSIARFYERRARRILPALLFLIAAWTVVGFFVFPPPQYADFAKGALATLFFVSNFWFLRSTGDYFGNSAEYEPLLHTWSLGVEEQFYLVFPLVFWALARRRRRTALISLIGAASVASFALSVWATAAAPIANFFLTPMRAWELGIGALLALGVAGVPRGRAQAEAAAAVGIVAIILSIAMFDDNTPFPGLAAAPACLGAAAIIWAGAWGRTTVGALLSTRPFVAIGLISYSLYLWHWPPLVVLRNVEGGVASGPMMGLAAVCLAALVAWASWAFVERPFRQPEAAGGLGRAAIFRYSATAAAALGGAMALIVATGGLAALRTPDALRDRYATATTRSGIEVECLEGTPRGEMCVFGAAAQRPRLMVWGDSHAAAMIPGFDNWARESGIGVTAAVKTGCPPLLGVDRADAGANHDCSGFNAATLRYLETNKEIRTVVLAARWALNAGGERYAGEDGRHAVLREVGQGAAGDRGNAAIFEAGLSRTVSALRAMGREVVIVEGVPEIGFDVPRAVLDTAFLGRPAEGPKRADYDARNALAASILGRVSEKYGATIVGMADLLCAERCAIERDGALLYRDDDHLSVTAAQWLVPEMMRRWRSDTY